MDVAAAGGWSDTTTLKQVYQQADPEVMSTQAPQTGPVQAFLGVRSMASSQPCAVTVCGPRASAKWSGDGCRGSVYGPEMLQIRICLNRTLDILFDRSSVGTAHIDTTNCAGVYEGTIESHEP